MSQFLIRGKSEPRQSRISPNGEESYLMTTISPRQMSLPPKLPIMMAIVLLMGSVVLQ